MKIITLILFILNLFFYQIIIEKKSSDPFRRVGTLLFAANKYHKIYHNTYKDPINILKIDAQNFTTDNFGNIYVINQSELKKYNSDGKLTHTYSNNNNGIISSIDVSNPVRILFFYQEYYSLIFLDNTLSPISDFQYFDINIYEPVLVCSSVQNGFWIFENTNNQLIHFTENYKKNNSIRINLFEKSFEPNFILERNNQIYINYPDTGIVVYSNLCNFQKIIQIKNLINFQITEENLLYFDTLKQAITVYNFKQENLFDIDIPRKEKKTNARIEQDRLYFLIGNLLYIYRFNSRL